MTTQQRMQRVMSRERGVSLMETMMALIIIAMVLAFGMPAFGRYKGLLSRRQAVAQVVEDLRAARQLAITQRSPVVVSFGNGVSTTNITTYRVHTDKNGDKITQSTELAVNNRMPTNTTLSRVSLAPVDTVIFDISGILKSGTSGGYLVIAAKNRVDTLWVSMAGMVYAK